MLNTTKRTPDSEKTTVLDAPVTAASPIPSWVRGEAAAIRGKLEQLQRARTDIPQIQQQIARLQETLTNAQQLAGDLSESLPLRQRALELLCGENNWELNDSLVPPPAGKVEAGLRADRAVSQAFGSTDPQGSHAGLPVVPAAEENSRG